MADLKSLQWLVWYMNICGLVPFRMELNRKTKTFERIVLSYCHPVTWWFVVVVGLQIGMLVYLGGLISKTFLKSIMGLHSITIFTTVLQIVSIMILFFVPRLLLFYYKSLGETGTFIRNVDDVLKQVGPWPCTSKIRTICGIAVVIFTSSAFVLANSKGFRLLLSNEGTFLYYFMSFIILLTFSQTGCLHLWFHLSYYTVAHRLEALAALVARREQNANARVTIVPERIEQNPWNSKPLGEQLRTLKHLYCCLYRCTVKLNSSFSLVIWLTVAIKTVTLVTALFLFLIAVLQKTPLANSSLESNAASIVLDVTHLLIIFVAVDLPTEKVRELEREVMNISNQPMSECDKLEVISFQTLISEDHFRLKAGGQFQVGMHLIPTLSGAVLTYLIILLQSALDNKN